MLLKSTILFLVCFAFILTGLILDVVSFTSAHWLVSAGDREWYSGLWQTCRTQPGTNNTGDTVCFPVQKHGYILSHEQSNATGKIFVDFAVQEMFCFLELFFSI